MYRLSKLARDINTGIQTLVDYAFTLGYSIDPDPNTKIEKDLYIQVIRRFGDTNINLELDEELGINATDNSLKVSNLVTLIELFDSKIFRIPDYQRGFSWSENQLNDLWKDLKDITGTNKHFTGIISLERVSNHSKFRFSKELNENNFNAELDYVIQNKSYTPYFIVDGQQRLTSLIILLQVLIEYFQKNHKDEVETTEAKKLIIEIFDSEKLVRFGYEKDTPSHQFLLNKIFNLSDVKITEPETIYTKNLLATKEFFREKIENTDSTEIDTRINPTFSFYDKKRLFEKIQKNLLFNILILDSKELDISMVFETLNYRGKPLTKLEILKNRLMFLTSKRFADDNHKCLDIRNQITQTWLNLYEWLGKSKSSINQIDDDSFLRAFWIMYFNHDERKETLFNLFETDLFDEKYRINEVSQNELLREIEIYKLLNSLNKTVKAWHYISHPESNIQDSQTYVDENFTFYLKMLNKIEQGRYVRPTLMAVLTRRFDDDEKEDKEIKNSIVRSVERHHAVLFLINGKSADTNKAQCWRLANKIFDQRHGYEGSVRYDGNNFLDINKFFNSGVWNNHNRENLREFVHSNRIKNERFWDWKGRDYILLQYEWHLRETKIHLREPNQPYYTYPLFIKPTRNNKLTPVFKFDKEFLSGIEHRQDEASKRLEYSIGNIFLTEKPYKKGDFVHAELKYLNELNFLKPNGQLIARWTFNRIKERGVEILSFIEEQYDIRLGDDGMKAITVLDGAQY